MSVFQGDFLGFQLGNEHSYGINITRVSTNDRYQDTLLPQFNDAVVQVPGGDGTYYWDTYYTQKPFTIDFLIIMSLEFIRAKVRYNQLHIILLPLVL